MLGIEPIQRQTSAPAMSALELPAHSVAMDCMSSVQCQIANHTALKYRTVPRPCYKGANECGMHLTGKRENIGSLHVNSIHGRNFVVKRGVTA